MTMRGKRAACFRCAFVQKGPIATFLIKQARLAQSVGPFFFSVIDRLLRVKYIPA